MYFLNLFSSFYVFNVLSISSSSSFDECKLDGGKRFLSMSTCRTLTLGCRCPIINWPQEKLTVSSPYKRMSIRTCCRSTDETHHRIPQQVSWQRVPLKFAGKVIPNLQCNKRNPKLHIWEKTERKLAKNFVSEHLSFRSLRSFFWYSCWFVSVAFSFFFYSIFFFFFFLVFFFRIKRSAKMSPWVRA